MGQVQPETYETRDDGFSQFFSDAACRELSTEPQVTAEVQKVLGNLLAAYRRLRVASYRIGYLEYEVGKYRELQQAQEDQLEPAGQSTLLKLEMAPTKVGHQPREPKALNSPVRGEVAALAEGKVQWWHRLADAIAGSDHQVSENSRNGEMSYYAIIRRAAGVKKPA